MATPAAMPTLRRTLGRWDLTAIGVNQVVGAAIFLLPADVARQVGDWGPVMFAAIGLTSLLVALCFAEVGSRFDTHRADRSGPARVAFGRFVGFEVGWMLWFSRVSSGASVINGLALALGFYWPALSSGLPRALVILGVLGGLTWANLRGIKQASWLVNALHDRQDPAARDLRPGRDLGRRSQPGGALGHADAAPTPARPRCC